MYDRKISEFIRTFVSEIQNSNAGIFAGAGLSQPAGYVNWKELLRDIADELGLDVDKEDDLIAVAQYHVNENGGRGKLNQVLIENFTKDAQSTRNHEILSQLPIDTYWTTNYDHLIEDSLRANNKIVDVKMTPQNLAITKSNADAIVYKMHGDVQMSDQAVLTKDDYEEYEVTKRRLYLFSPLM
ncbi:SIR2 family protein, partial [Bacillus glycinifermentans]